MNRLIKPSLQHFQLCRFVLSLGIFAWRHAVWALGKIRSFIWCEVMVIQVKPAVDSTGVDKWRDRNILVCRITLFYIMVHHLVIIQKKTCKYRDNSGNSGL
jgi:hypothetical protein